MLTTAQGAIREELERKFLAEHASFARGWSLERHQRTSTWTSPGGTARIAVTVIPFEYKEHPANAGGLWGEALEWDESVLRRHEDGTWHPVHVRLTPLKGRTTKRITRRRAS